MIGTSLMKELKKRILLKKKALKLLQNMVFCNKILRRRLVYMTRRHMWLWCGYDDVFMLWSRALTYHATMHRLKSLYFTNFHSSCCYRLVPKTLFLNLSYLSSVNLKSWRRKAGGTQKTLIVGTNEQIVGWGRGSVRANINDEGVKNCLSEHTFWMAPNGMNQIR